MSENILERLLNHEISEEEARMELSNLRKKSGRGRPRKIITEAHDYKVQKNRERRAAINMSIWGHWLRLTPYKFLRQNEKKWLISNAMNVSVKKVEQEVTKFNKFKKRPDAVIKITPNSLVICTEDDIKRAKFSHSLGVDMLDDFIKIEQEDLIK